MKKARNLQKPEFQRQYNFENLVSIKITQGTVKVNNKRMYGIMIFGVYLEVTDFSFLKVNPSTVFGDI